MTSLVEFYILVEIYHSCRVNTKTSPSLEEEGGVEMVWWERNPMGMFATGWCFLEPKKPQP